MDRLPLLGALYSAASCLVLSTLWSTSPTILRISCPAGVTRVRCLPLREKISTPSSSSRRSEERRVGKECSSRWSPYQYKKKVVKQNECVGTRQHAQDQACA